MTLKSRRTLGSALTLLGAVGYHVLNDRFNVDGAMGYGLALTAVGVVLAMDYGELFRSMRSAATPKTVGYEVWCRPSRF